MVFGAGNRVGGEDCWRQEGQEGWSTVPQEEDSEERIVRTHEGWQGAVALEVVALKRTQAFHQPCIWASRPQDPAGSKRSDTPQARLLAWRKGILWTSMSFGLKGSAPWGWLSAGWQESGLAQEAEGGGRGGAAGRGRKRVRKGKGNGWSLSFPAFATAGH